MVKLVALFTRPDDPAGFDRLYTETHLPLARRMPGLVRLESTRFTGTPTGQPAPYDRMAELYFESKDAMQAAMVSEEGKAAGANLMGFAKGLVTFVFAEVKE